MLNQIKAQDSIIKFFSLLLICTGVAVKHDVEGAIKFYSLISNLDVTMKGFIEIAAVALVAGYAGKKHECSGHADPWSSDE